MIFAKSAPRLLNVITYGLLASAISLSAAKAEGADQPKLNVVATFSILGDLAKQIAGDRIELTTLVGPGGDVHVYEPRPSDAAALKKADLILVNGLHMEGFIDRLVEASGTKAKLIVASKGADILKSDHDHHAHEDEDKADADKHEEAHDHEKHEAHQDGEPEAAHADHTHEHGPEDPHAWQSVPNAEIYVKNITQGLCEADQAGCTTYQANQARYEESLKALDQGIRTEIAAIPAEKRTIISSHDAFGYFAHEYGIKFLAAHGASTDAEPSAADIANLIRQARDEKASAIFVESISNPKLVEQIASETGMVVGGQLYSDALSEPDGPAATYEQMMRHNVKTITQAITGATKAE